MRRGGPDSEKKTEGCAALICARGQERGPCGVGGEKEYISIFERKDWGHGTSPSETTRLKEGGGGMPSSQEEITRAWLEGLEQMCQSCGISGAVSFW